MRPYTRTRLTTLAFLLFAWALRLWRLGAQSLWYDETVSTLLARKPVLDMIRHTAGDIHPPGYYLLLHYWYLLTGHYDYAYALFSALWGLLIVALTYTVARRLFSRPAALLATLLAAFHPFQIWYSQEVRMYTLGAFLGLLSTYFLARWLGMGAAHTRTRRHHPALRPPAGGTVQSTDRPVIKQPAMNRRPTSAAPRERGFLSSPLKGAPPLSPPMHRRAPSPGLKAVRLHQSQSLPKAGSPPPTAPFRGLSPNVARGFQPGAPSDSRAQPGHQSRTQIPNPTSQIRSPKSLLLWILTSALSLYILYYSAFLIAAQNLFVLPYLLLRALRHPKSQIRNPKSEIRNWFLAQIAVVALYLPWLPTFIRQATHPPVPPWRGFISTWQVARDAFSALILGHGADPARYWPVLLLALALLTLPGLQQLLEVKIENSRLNDRRPKSEIGERISASAHQRIRHSPFAILYLLTAIILPVALIHLLSYLVPLFHPRYVFLYSPPITILLAAGILHTAHHTTHLLHRALSEQRSRGAEEQGSQGVGQRGSPGTGERHLQSEIRNPKSEIRNPLPAIRHSLLLTASRYLLTAIVLVPMLLSLRAYHFDTRYAPDDYRTLVADLLQQIGPDDVVLVNAGYTYTVLEHYWPLPIAWRGRLYEYPSEGILPDRGLVIVMTGAVDGPPDLGWGDPRSDFYSISAADTDRALARLFAHHPRVWQLRAYDTVLDPGGHIRRWLADHGTLTFDRVYTGESNVRLQAWQTGTLTEPLPPQPLVTFGNGRLELLFWKKVAPAATPPAWGALTLGVRLSSRQRQNGDAGAVGGEGNALPSEAPQPPGALQPLLRGPTVPLDLALSVRLYTPDGRVVAQRDLPLLFPHVRRNGDSDALVRQEDAVPSGASQSPGAPQSSAAPQFSGAPQSLLRGSRPIQLGFPLPNLLGVPPGTYDLQILFYDRATGLPLAPDPPTAAVAGQRLSLGPLQVPRLTAWPRAYWPKMAQTDTVHFLVPSGSAGTRIPGSPGIGIPGLLTLRGHTLSPATLRAGQTLALDLLWQARRAIDTPLTVRVTLRAADRPPHAEIRNRGANQRISESTNSPSAIRHSPFPIRNPKSPISNIQSPISNLSPGEVRLQHLSLPLPGHLSGTYWVQLDVLDPEGRPLWHFPPGAVILGTVQVEPRAANFTPPPFAHRADIRFGRRVTLLGYDLEGDLTPGSTLRVRLVFRAEDALDGAYKATVQLLGPGNVVLAQHDRPPGGEENPATGWLPGEIIVSDHTLTLPSDLPPRGDLRLILALYHPDTLARLPATTRDGVFLGDHALLTIP